MYCSKCGKEIPDDSVFCPECGTQLTTSDNRTLTSKSTQNTTDTTYTSKTEERGSNESPLNWYLYVLKKYTEFSGRAQRKEYWYFVLFNTIIYLGFMVFDHAIGSFSTEAGIGLLSGIYSLSVLIPSIAVTTRRLHDTNRSGWWLLIAAIPLIGAIVLIFFLASDSDPKNNQYGPYSKAT